MRASSLLIVTALVMASAARADDGHEYAVGRIPEGLRKYASAVVREDNVMYRIFNRHSAEETAVVAVTIFNGDGRKYGEQVLGYDRFSSIKDFDGAIYDAQGEEIKTLKSGDIKDESNISAYTLYEDSRVKSAELFHDRYPYTVVFTYCIKYSGMLGGPSWVAQESSDPVVHSRLEVIVPDDVGLRYAASNDSVRPAITVEGNIRRYVWEARNLPELSDDDLEEDIEKRTSVVRTAPMNFELDEHPGSTSDWKSFGAWSGGLFDGKTVLPPDAQNDISSLVDSTLTTRAKVEKIYRYMQKRTHYVNVSLGIGGWEPYDAAYVYHRGYGDCKALSNFMVSLLAGIGIKSYPALVYAGGTRSRTIAEFPSQLFNHVIVCVPQEPDSIWLECTSQDFPCGYLGAFTENRPALLLTPAGGILVRTPASTPSDNILSRIARVQIHGMGDAKASLRVRRVGNFSENVRSTMLYERPDKRERMLLDEVDVSGAKMVSSELKGLDTPQTAIEELLKVDLPAFSSTSGKRLFFQPNISHRKVTPPHDRKIRRSPVRYVYPSVSTDSVVYVLPDRSRCEALPSPVRLNTSFGSFQSSTVALGDTALLYVRRFEITQPEIPASNFQEYLSFIKAVARADKAQVVINRE